VKAVLSGEGADELFGGYRWVRVQSHYALRRILPRAPFRLLAERTDHPRWRRVLNTLAAEDDVAADAEWFRSFSAAEKAHLLHADFRAGGPDVLPLRPAPETLASCTDHLQRRLSLDFTGRLPDAILLMGDKMSMAHSLEVRMPFLDREVVNFALRLPSHMKVRRDCSKYVLSLLVKELPPEIARRTKSGLRYPVRSLFLGSTGRFVREFLLDSDPVGGMLNRRYIESRLDTWLSPQHRDYRRALTLLFLQSWWTEFFGSRPPGKSF
jgi:asparagine synthase (glutamine-hydrolysing)